MDAKRFVIGTLVGGVTVFATGALILALPPFRNFLGYAMNAASGTSVARGPQLLWAVGLGSLSYGALIVFAMGSRAGSLNIGTGVTTGTVVGFLLWFTTDFMFYGISNVGTLTSTIVDPLLELVPGAIAGSVMAAVLGKIR